MNDQNSTTPNDPNSLGSSLAPSTPPPAAPDPSSIFNQPAMPATPTFTPSSDPFGIPSFPAFNSTQQVNTPVPDTSAPTFSPPSAQPQNSPMPTPAQTWPPSNNPTPSPLDNSTQQPSPTSPDPDISQMPSTPIPEFAPASVTTPPQPLGNPSPAPTEANTFTQPPTAAPAPVDTGFNWSSAGQTPVPQAPPQPEKPALSTNDLYGPSGVQSEPTPVVPSIPTTAAPPQFPAASETAPIQSEPAPTDLSQLIASQPEGSSSGLPQSNSAPIDTSGAPAITIPISADPAAAPAYNPPLSQPETLVAPPQPGTAQAVNPTASHSGGIPKWVIGLGVGLLLAVAAASAYFILGVGQTKTASAPTSNPQTQITPPVTAAPTAQPVVVVVTPTPVASSSASSSFGALTGSTASASASPTSALQRARERTTN
jgi:hypothetical protein